MFKEVPLVLGLKAPFPFLDVGETSVRCSQGETFLSIARILRSVKHKWLIRVRETRAGTASASSQPVGVKRFDSLRRARNSGEVGIGSILKPVDVGEAPSSELNGT